MIHVCLDLQIFLFITLSCRFIILTRLVDDLERVDHHGRAKWANDSLLKFPFLVAMVIPMLLRFLV